MFTNHTANEIVAMLEDKGYKEAVIIGGTITISLFMRAQLLDDFYFIVEPVLFGSGLPLLKVIDQDTKLTLKDVSKFNDNTTQLHYQVKK